jgi:hypothetical protein
VTRISRTRAPDAIVEWAIRDVHVQAVRLDYDHERWARRFLAAWPNGSAAHASYWRRIEEGPRFCMP